MVKIILIAPSGGGKGTLARFLRNDLGVPHISAGEILRNSDDPEIKNLISRGIFLSDEVIGRIIVERLEEEDCERGYILDGFPRSLGQAQILETYGIEPDIVIELTATDEIVIDRMRGRWVCRRCRANHNEKLGPVDKCRNCGGETYQREDDKEEMIRKRLAQYRAQEEPMREFYEGKGVLLKIDSGADVKPSEIFLAVLEYIWSLKRVDEQWIEEQE
ncbi:MAG: nucleoside monophosphate kinase [Firmicutes bacterium]|nr:nucleoside monophosphate kinase [Bacillota bacterium]